MFFIWFLLTTTKLIEVLCHLLLLSQDFVQYSHNLWFFGWYHRNCTLIHPSHSICYTHISHTFWCVWTSDSVFASSIAGRGVWSESRWRYHNLEAPGPQEGQFWLLVEKGPSLPAQFWVCLKHLNKATCILQPVLHSTDCVLPLDRDQLCIQEIKHIKAPQ